MAKILNRRAKPDGEACSPPAATPAFAPPATGGNTGGGAGSKPSALAVVERACKEQEHRKVAALLGALAIGDGKADVSALLASETLGGLRVSRAFG